MRASLKVGPVEAASGETVKAVAPIGHLADGITPVQIPIVIVNGREDGPVLYLQAGAHGQESVYAIEALRRLWAALDPAQLRGAVIAVPLANPLAHHAATRVAPQMAAREGVAFAGDLQNLWPGDPRGSLTQRIAYFLSTRILRQCDCALDLHAVGEPGMAFTFLIQGGRQDAAGMPAWERTLDLARAFGLTIVTTPRNPATLVGQCLDAGKPAFMVEMVAARVLSEAGIAAALRGIGNVMIRLGMTGGAIEPQSGMAALPGPLRTAAAMRAQHGGIIRYEAGCGTWLRSGTVIARICDVFGTEVEVIAMPVDGYVMTFPPLSWVGTQSVATGDLVADICA